jgi:hypothetical protein
MFINALASDLHLDVLDQDVTEPVQPTETRGTRHGHCGKLRAEVHAVNQITIAGDGAGNFLAEIGRTIDGLFFDFHQRPDYTLSKRNHSYFQTSYSERRFLLPTTI